MTGFCKELIRKSYVVIGFGGRGLITVSSDFGKSIVFKGKLCIDGLLYAWATKGGLKKLQVVLESSRLSIIQTFVTLEVCVTHS